MVNEEIVSESQEIWKTQLKKVLQLGNSQALLQFLQESTGENLKNHVNSPIFERNRTVLHLAALHGFTEAATLLLENGAEVDRKDQKIPGINHCTPLHLASRRGHLETVKTLVRFGANVNELDVKGKTSLHRAVKSNTEVVKFLVEKKADLTCNGILSSAAKKGSTETVSYLISLGIDINETDSHGKTPLHHSIKNQNWEVVEYLINHRADWHLPDKDGRSPLEIIEIMGKEDIYTYITSTYEAVASNNIVDLKKIVKDHFQNYKRSEATRSRLNHFLSLAYERVKITNVPITKEMEKFVNDLLIDLNFDGNGHKQLKIDPSLETMVNRIDELVQNMRELIDTEMIEKWLLMARFIAEDIHILKRQLKSTFHILPWSELEFCITVFVGARMKHKFAFFRILINKEVLSNHVRNFAYALEIEKDKLTQDYMKSKYPSDWKRDDVKKNIEECYPFFIPLLIDYENIRTLYSLNRLDYYLKEAITVNLEEKGDIGKFVIQRAIQVIGECLKNTIESPNVSQEVHHYLIVNLPRNMSYLVSSLRDNLSHYQYLRKRIKMENDIGIFVNIQNDMKKFQIGIMNLLNKRKGEALRKFMEKFVDYEDSEISLYLIDDITLLKSELQDTISQLEEGPGTLGELKSLIDQLRDTMADKTENEKELFSEIDRVISIYEKKAYNVKRKFLKSLTNIDRIFNFATSLETPVDFCRDSARLYRVGQINTYSIPKLDIFKGELTDLVMSLGDSIRQRPLNNNNTLKMCQLFADIIFYVNMDINRLKALDSMKKKMVETDSIYVQFYEDNLTTILTNVANDIKNENDRSKYTDALYNAIAKKKIGSKKTSFEILMDSVRKSLNEEAKYKIVNQVKTFIKSIIKGQKLQNEINAIIENTFAREEDSKAFFIQRLKNLESAIGLKKESIIIENKQCYDIAIEMILLDLTEVLESMKLLDRSMFLEGECYSAVIGKTLRNYLAHGGMLIEILPIDIEAVILSNAEHFIESGTEIFEKKLKNCQPSTEHSKNIQNRRIRNISWVNKTEILFRSCEIDESEEIIEHKDVDVRSRNFYDQTLLHISILNNHSKAFMYYFKKGLNPLLEDKFNKSCIDCIFASRNNEILNMIVSTIDLTSENLAEGSSNNVIVRYLFKRLKEQGAFPDECTEDDANWTLLHVIALTGNEQFLSCLLERDIDVDVRTVNNYTPLHIATANGRSSAVEVLLQNGASVNARMNDNWVALHTASVRGMTEIVTILLDHGADIDILGGSDQTPLHLACTAGHLEVVEELLKRGAPFDVQDGQKWTPLHCAASHGNCNIVQMLLSLDAPKNVKNNTGSTPMHLASMNGHCEIVKMLIDQGADFSVKNDSEWTPLLVACYFGHEDVVKVLLENNDNPNSATSQGWCCLHSAASRGCLGVTKLLLAHGADINFQDNIDRITPLHAAITTGNLEIAQELLANGARIDMGNGHGHLPLHVAAREGHGGLVKDLLNIERNVNILSHDGQNALHHAAFMGRTDVAKILLNERVDIDVEDQSHASPLYWAATKGFKDMVKLLAENGADVNFNNGSFTLLEYAAMRGYHDIAEILLSHGCSPNKCQLQSPLIIATRCGNEDIVETLIKKRADVNVTTKDGISALNVAAHIANEKIVTSLISAGANVNQTGVDLWTPLHNACEVGDASIAELLLKHGAVPNVLNQGDIAPLHLAVDRGFQDVTEILLKHGADINLEGPEKHTPLNLAACKGHRDIVQYLIENGAKIDVISTQNYTALHLAADNEHGEIVEMLIDNGANVDFKGFEGKTPLHCATQQNDLEITQILLNRGAFINIQDENGQTPLHLAINKGYVDIVRCLLKKRADINIEDSKMETPLSLAIEKGYESIVEMLLNEDAIFDAAVIGNKRYIHQAVEQNSLRIVQILLQKGVSVNNKDDHGQTPLSLAIVKGYTDIVQCLLENGAHFDVENSEMSPLLLAVVNNHKAIVEMLIEAGANINHAGVQNRTPLHCAVIGNVPDIVQILLNKRVFTNCKDDNGLTPLHIAICKGCPEIIKMLLCNEETDIEATDTHSNTPLHYAVLVENITIINLLLEKGAAIDSLNIEKCPPLHLAIQKRNRNVVELLLKHSPDLLIRNHHDTVLHQCVHGRNPHVLRSIIAEIKLKYLNCFEEVLNAQDTEGDTPLMWAAENGYADMAKILLDNGARINDRNLIGMTALDWAIKNKHPHTAKLIIHYGEKNT